MDAAFSFLKQAGDVKRKSLEFYCPTLDQHEKEVLCSMACLSGAYTAFTVEEEGAPVLTLDLGAVEPMLMLPCDDRKDQKDAKIVPKTSKAGLELNAGQIGGYTGGTIEELRKAASMLDGQKLALGFRLSICPATSHDYLQAAEEGILSKFIDFGAQINAAGDHSVVIQGAGAMGHKERLVTTGLYTFAGSMGCDDAEVYTGSVETVMNASFAKQM